MTSIQIDRTDGLSSSTAFKGPCKAATTVNIALYGEQTLDGIAIVTGDRVMVKDQAAGYENGIYVVDTGQWRRAKDFSRNNDVREGTQVFVANGTTYERTLWCVTTNDPIVIGTNDVTFLQTIVSAFELEALIAQAEAAAAAAEAAAASLPPITANTMLVDNAAGTSRESKSFPDVRNLLDLAVFVDTRTALKALDTTKDVNAYLRESGREGHFLWVAGDFSTLITADTLEGLYIKANAIASSAGAWVRQGGWAVTGVDARWFGYVANYNSTTGAGTDMGPLLASILAISTVMEVHCPTGLAKLDNLEIPKGKVVRGVKPAFESFLANTRKPDNIKGTVWCTRAAGVMSSGRPTNEIVRLNQYSGLADVLIFHDGQPTPGVGWTPTNTPWGVRAGRFADTTRDVRAEHCWMEGVTVLAFTHCIEFQKGGEGGYIRDCKWHGFNIGLSLDNIHHIIMLDNTEAYPYWNGDANVQIYMYNNYVAYEIGRVDGLRVKGGMFSIWTNVGVGFVPSRSTDFPNQSSAFIDVDSIYSDSCVHGFMVYPGITGAPMTGTIGHMIVHRASITGLDIDSNPAVDYGVRLRGWCDFHVHHFEGSGSGFARKGGHVVATTDGSKMSIGHARVCEWDTDGLNKPAFSFGVAGTELSIEQPLDIFQGSGGWFVTTKRLFQGDASAGENNITTGRHLYLDGIGFVSNRSVTVNSAEQTLFASHPVKMLSAGYREYRARGRVGTHATTTTLTLHAGSATVITTALSCPASGSTLDVDGTWKTINLDPTTEPEFGALQAIGTPGDASLLFLRLGFEFR